jgi:hypothetical protein
MRKTKKRNKHKSYGGISPAPTKRKRGHSPSGVNSPPKKQPREAWGNPRQTYDHTMTHTMTHTINLPSDIDMKLLLLSLFAHDTCHDFRHSNRTFNKKSGTKEASDIVAKMTHILDTVSKKRIEYTPKISTLDYETMVSDGRAYTETEAVPRVTIFIFGNAIEESIRISGYMLRSLITGIQLGGGGETQLKEFAKNIIDSITKNLENPYITKFPFFSIYAAPIKEVLTTHYRNISSIFNQLKTAIGTAEKQLRDSLFAQLELPNKIQLDGNTDAEIIHTIKTTPVNWEEGDACIEKIQQLDENNLKENADCVKKYSHKYALTHHPDKNSKAKTDEFAKNFARIQYLNQKLQSSVTPPQKGGNYTLEKMNDSILTEIVRWVLLYLDCAIESVEYDIQPKFVEVFALDDTKTRAKKNILNAQILILYCFYNFAKFQKTTVDTLTHIQNTVLTPHAKTFNHYLIENLLHKDKMVGSWLTRDIDKSIKESSEIIIREMLRENIVIDLKDIIPQQLDGKRFIINNAASLMHFRSFINREMVYCPVTSIADAMSNCSYAVDKPKRLLDSENAPFAIYPMGLCIQNTSGPKSVYSIKFRILTESTISIDGYVENERTPMKIMIQQTVGIDKVRNKELSATIAYRGMVDTILTFLGTSDTPISAGIDIQTPLSHSTNGMEFFMRGISQKIIESICIKSIGDWGQEVTSVAKFGAIDGTRAAINPIMRQVNAINYDEDGNALRLGIAGDRPSAFRMIYMNIFAERASINAKAVVGYAASKDTSFFVRAFRETTGLRKKRGLSRKPSGIKHSKSLNALGPKNDRI